MQGLKAVVVEAEGLTVVASEAVNYEKDFKEYKLDQGGVCRGSAGRVTQPTAMVCSYPSRFLLRTVMMHSLCCSISKHWMRCFPSLRLLALPSRT